MLHGPVYQKSHMTKLSEKYLTEHYNRKPPLLKTPMREEKFALYASIVMLIILGIGVLGFAIG